MSQKKCYLRAWGTSADNAEKIPALEYMELYSSIGRQNINNDHHTQMTHVVGYKRVGKRGVRMLGGHYF